MQTVDIYIDTDIKGPKRRDGTYMYIIATQTTKGTADAGKMKSIPQTTENQATLLALQAALKRLRSPCMLVFHLECTYVASALINGWYKQWRERDWMTAQNRTVADAKIWQSIEYLLNAHEFSVSLKEPHTYKAWMRRTLKREEGNNG